MTDAITIGAAKLQLDEVTGEMVSKGELKKRIQKRAKKARAKKVAAAKAKEDGPAKAPAVPKLPPKAKTSLLSP